MKNILMTVISLLLTGLIIIVIVKGISVGNFKILSIKDIKEESMQMDADIEKLNELKNTDYKKKVSDLQDATKSLTKSKNDYLDIASMSSDEEIKQAKLKEGEEEEEEEQSWKIRNRSGINFEMGSKTNRSFK